VAFLAAVAVLKTQEISPGEFKKSNTLYTNQYVI
jgi:hypothetical protein